MLFESKVWCDELENDDMGFMAAVCVGMYTSEPAIGCRVEWSGDIIVSSCAQVRVVGRAAASMGKAVMGSWSWEEGDCSVSYDSLRTG